MDPQPLREITNDAAAELAEWWAIAYDLDHVISATTKLLSLFDDHSKDLTLIRALWTSALIAYIRCFTPGRRARLDPEIYKQLQGQPLETHQWYKDTRDKHIAHPVSRFEETKIGLFIDESGMVAGLGHLYVFRASDDRPGVRQFGVLATVARKHVTGVIQAIEAKNP